MASKKKLSEKADKRYRAKVTIGHDPDGKPIVKYASGRTKKELEEAKEELIKRHVTGTPGRQKDILFGQYALEWFDVHKKPTIGFSARSSYATALNRHILPILGERQLKAITANDLQSLLNDKAGLARSTVGNIYSIIVNVFRTAYAQGLIERNPSVALTKHNRESDTRRALTEAETAAILRVAETHPKGLLISLLYYTGMRLGEACGLMWDDVDFKKRLIRIRRDVDFKEGKLGEVKTKFSIRDIPMPDELYNLLLPLRGLGNAFVFPAQGGTFWKNSSVQRLWLELMAEAYTIDNTIERRIDKSTGQPMPVSAVTAHYLRHNYASVLYHAGVDVMSAQKYLGHAKPQTTLNIYTHISEENMHKDAEKARAAFAKK